MEHFLFSTEKVERLSGLKENPLKTERMEETLGVGRIGKGAHPLLIHLGLCLYPCVGSMPYMEDVSQP